MTFSVKSTVHFHTEATISTIPPVHYRQQSFTNENLKKCLKLTLRG